MASGMTKALAAGLFLIGALCASMLSDLWAIRAIEDQVAKFRASGADIFVVAAPKAVDPRRCEALQYANDVMAAGALKQSGPVYPAVTPASASASFEVSPSFPRVLGSTPTGSGVVIADELARTVGVGVGDDFFTLKGRTTISGVYGYPQDGRRSGFSYAILTPTPAVTAFDECWVRVWPIPTDIRQRLMFAVAHQERSSAPAVVSQVNSTLGDVMDPVAAFHHRPTSYFPLALVALCALATGLVWSTRRLELAQSRHSGIRLWDLLAIAATEFSIIATALVVVGFSALAVSVNLFFPASDWHSLVLLGCSHIAGAVVGGLVGAIFVVGTASERQLLRSFRERR